jgi:hypothetical protein
LIAFSALQINRKIKISVSLHAVTLWSLLNVSFHDDVASAFDNGADTLVVVPAWGIDA